MIVPYALGIDVGTTFTAAAISRDGTVETFSLGTYEVAVPSVIFAAGGDLLFGSPAVRRGAAQPGGLAREFKRRIGDPVPLVLSGSPYHADRLTALMARWVVQTVSEQIGEAPASIVMTHPANWTMFQIGSLETALKEVGLDVELITEPAAAALDYADTARIAVGEQLLVYDLGGGTFDVALLRRTGDGFEHEIEPFGMARLGGIDFDEAIFQYVIRQLPPDIVRATGATPEGMTAIANMRRQCVEAKMSLSSDTAADVPVLLPDYTATVRLTRSEFEDMIRPMIEQTVEGVGDMLRRAKVDAADLEAVLLAGGSSRVPLVAEMVAQRLGVRARVDAHPKLVVARGAARRAGELASGSSGRPPPGAVVDGGEGSDHRRLTLVAAAVVVAAVVGITAWALTRADDPQTGATASSDTVRDTTPASSSTTTTDAPTTTTAPIESMTFASQQLCPTSPRPLDLAVVSGDVWLTSSDAATLERCDGSELGPPTASVAFGPRPVSPEMLTGYELLSAGGFLYVTQREASSVARVDVETMGVEQIPVGGFPFGATVLGDDIWIGLIGNGGPNRVVRLDEAQSGAGIEIPFGPGYLRAIDGVLWVPSLGTHKIGRIEPATGTVTVFDVAGEPLDILKVGDDLWVTLRGANQVIVMDPETGATIDTIEVGSTPHMIIEAFGSVWVSNAGDNTVSRIDPVTRGEVQAPIPVGPGPVALAAGSDRIYVANLNGSAIDVLTPRP